MRMITPRDQRPGCVLRIVATRATVNFSDGSDGIFLIVSGDCDKSVNFQHRRPFLEVFPDEFPSNSRRLLDHSAAGEGELDLVNLT